MDSIGMLIDSFSLGQRFCTGRISDKSLITIFFIDSFFELDAMIALVWGSMIVFPRPDLLGNSSRESFTGPQKSAEEMLTPQAWCPISDASSSSSAFLKDPLKGCFLVL
jgi:hypothetical protein